MARARSTVGVLITGGGVTCALTLVFLSMRAVMNVGGRCVSGGSAYEVAVRCPKHVAGVMPLAIWGGLMFAGLYVWQVSKAHAPSLVSLIWPGLFISLGYNFLDYGIRGGGVGGWLVPGVVFVLMGGVPLVLTLPGLVRHLLHGEEMPTPWHVSATGNAVGALKTLSRLAPAPRGDMADQLAKLDQLHRSGALDDLEYANAKDKVIRGQAT